MEVECGSCTLQAWVHAFLITLGVWCSGIQVILEMIVDNGSGGKLAYLKSACIAWRHGMKWIYIGFRSIGCFFRVVRRVSTTWNCSEMILLWSNNKWSCNGDEHINC